VARLTEDEQKQLDALEAKRKAADDDDDRGRRVHVNIDMSDEKAVRRAVRSGYLPESALDEIDDDGDGGDEGDDDGKGGKPKPKGKAAADDDTDEAPRRRLRGADGWASS
jgi:hypothetical protein